MTKSKPKKLPQARTKAKPGDAHPCWLNALLDPAGSETCVVPDEHVGGVVLGRSVTPFSFQLKDLDTTNISTVTGGLVVVAPIPHHAIEVISYKSTSNWAPANAQVQLDSANVNALFPNPAGAGSKDAYRARCTAMSLDLSLDMQDRLCSGTIDVGFMGLDADAAKTTNDTFGIFVAKESGGGAVSIDNVRHRMLERTKYTLDSTTKNVTVTWKPSGTPHFSAISETGANPSAKTLVSTGFNSNAIVLQITGVQYDWGGTTPSIGAIDGPLVECTLTQHWEIIPVDPMAMVTSPVRSVYDPSALAAALNAVALTDSTRLIKNRPAKAGVVEAHPAWSMTWPKISIPHQVKQEVAKSVGMLIGGAPGAAVASWFAGPSRKSEL